jgi:tetratricopeptide (TPR) repeat protein
LFRTDEQTWHVLIGVFSAWFLIVLSQFLYSSTMTTEFLFWLTTAMLVVVHKRDFYVLRFERSPRASIAVTFVFVLLLVSSISGLFVEGQRYAAEVSYANAITTYQAQGSMDDVLADLTSATELNGSNDVYLRNLSVGLIAKSDELFRTTPSVERLDGESEPAHKARLQAAAQEQLRQATSIRVNAVLAARRATEVNANNVANWAMLASAYQSHIGITEGVEKEARASFEKAIALEPNNPALRTELGKVIIRQADLAAAGLQSQNQDERNAAQKDVDVLLGEASDQFNRAIDAKKDYAPAHYQLALVLDRQGKVKEAIERMENVVSLNPTDTGVGFQLALLYFRDERKDDAVRLMEAVVRIQPDFSNARWYLAAMYEDRGDLDAAIVQIEEVAKLNEGNSLVVEKLGQLRAAKEAPPAEGEDALPQPVEEPVVNANQPGLNR